MFYLVLNYKKKKIMISVITLLQEISDKITITS